MYILALPGLIDPHAHLRDPGQTDAEDFHTGTMAALAGGFTTVLDMPDNKDPITSAELLQAKIANAQKQIVSDVGFYFAGTGSNQHQFAAVADKVVGLHVRIDKTMTKDVLLQIYKTWPNDKPIALTCREDMSALVLATLKAQPKPTHISHVSTSAELSWIMKAKAAGLSLTCGVTPQHLFLTQQDEADLGPYGKIKPSLKSKSDVNFLWDHMDGIDVIESDHSPQTKAAKDGDDAPFGVPALETVLPLMLTAQEQGKIAHTDLLDRLHANPARIFGVPIDPGNIVEVDMREYRIKNSELLTKPAWSPFDGRRVVGKVKRVTLHGTIVYEDGKILAAAGSGKVLPK